MRGRAFWGGVIEFARWFSSGGFALWGLGLILLAVQSHDPSRPPLAAFTFSHSAGAISALSLGTILIVVGVLLFLQLGRAKRTLMRPR
jgi:hypothetical protein